MGTAGALDRRKLMEQQYLPISDAMGRDIDKGIANGRDIADFLPDAVAQEMLDMSRPGPVHAENLIPISPDHAREMRTQKGDTLPKMPATRRVIPAPYRRDRITGGRHGKSWQEVPPSAIQPGDIITDIGLVVIVGTAIRYESVADNVPEGTELAMWRPEDKVAMSMDVVVTGAGGRAISYRANGPDVRVFR